MPGQSYKIGRIGADITCPTDSSVSKSHAKITVVTKQGHTRPEVVLEDVGSKFGTHMNDGILAESQRLAGAGGVSRALTKPRILQDGDRIRFGVAYSIFRLKWLELEVTCSMLRDKSELNTWLSAVEPGVSVKPNMSDTTSHLVMSNISLSIKVQNNYCEFLKHKPLNLYILGCELRVWLSGLKIRQVLSS